MLHVVETATPGGDVVEKLDGWLERAKKGEFSAVAIAMVSRDGNTSSGWSEQPNIQLMVAATQGLAQRMVNKLIAE